MERKSLGYVVQQRGGTGSWGNADLLTDIEATEFEEDTADTTALTVTEGISGGTEYFFRVSAQSSPPGLWSGNTPDNSTTGAASVTTPAGVPGAPGLVITASVDADDNGTVRLTLAPAAGGGSDVTRYELQIWYDGKWNEADDLDDTLVAQVIDGLTPGVKYYFAARAWNSAGYGPWSSPISKRGCQDWCARHT